ncbi:MAG: asparaginase [Acidimicrobiia bacterium]
MSLLAAKVRSGLVETLHNGAVAVMSRDGSLLAHAGDIDRPFFLRSAAKPFQAAVAHGLGADLTSLELAVASASHEGLPVHVALVGSILARSGLDSSNLGCPPAWPISSEEVRRLARAGNTHPRPIWHNCSGKHASWLRASQERNWPLSTYLEPEHPLQRAIIESVSALGDMSAGPVGVDGCGAPVMRTTTRVMARLFAALGNEPTLQAVFVAMHRYPAMTSGWDKSDSRLAVVSNVAAKRGAEGCLGLATHHGPGVAVKSWDGSEGVASVTMAAVLTEIAVGSSYVADQLSPMTRAPIPGGGREVGALESRLELKWE